MWLRQLAGPTDLPIDVNELKGHLRIDSDDEDPTLLTYLRAAIADVEDGTARALMPQTFTQVMDGFPGEQSRLYSLETPGAGDNPIVLLRSPVTAVTAIRYVDVNAVDPTVFTVWNATQYLLDKDTEPARITPMFPLVYPITYPRMNSVEVDISAGYASRDVIPARLRELVFMLAAHYYETREPVVVGTNIGGKVPQGIDTMIWNERVHHSY